MCSALDQLTMRASDTTAQINPECIFISKSTKSVNWLSDWHCQYSTNSILQECSCYGSYWKCFIWRTLWSLLLLLRDVQKGAIIFLSQSSQVIRIQVLSCWCTHTSLTHWSVVVRQWTLWWLNIDVSGSFLLPLVTPLFDNLSTLDDLWMPCCSYYCKVSRMGFPGLPVLVRRLQDSTDIRWGGRVWKS